MRNHMSYATICHTYHNNRQPCCSLGMSQQVRSSQVRYDMRKHVYQSRDSWRGATADSPKHTLESSPPAAIEDETETLYLIGSLSKHDVDGSENVI